MDYVIKTFVMVILASFVLKDTTAVECTAEEQQKCVVHRDNYFASLNYSSDLLIYQLTDEHLRHYCHIFDNSIKSCYRELRQNCIPRVQARFIGIEQSLDYLCNDAYEEYLDVKACLQTEQVYNEVSICVGQFRRKLEIINDFSNTATDEYCEAVADLADCEADALAVTCSREAEKWAREYSSKLYTPEMIILGCVEPPKSTEPPSDSSSSWWIIAAAVGGALAFFIIVILIVVFLYRSTLPRRKRNQEDRERGRSCRERGIPNPYVGGPSVNPNTGGGSHFHSPPSSPGHHPHMFDDSFGQPAWTQVNGAKYPKHSKNKRKGKKKNVSTGDLNDQYLTPTPSNIGPSKMQSSSYPSPPSYKERDYYNPATPPPSYTSQESQYQPLQTPTRPPVQEFDNNAYEEPVVPPNPPESRNTYEELPDIRAKTTPKR